MELEPWKLSGMLTPTRTVGQVALRKNGTFLDVLFRADGQTRWFAIRRNEVEGFLTSSENEVALHAESDGNAECCDMLPDTPQPRTQTETQG